MAVRKIGLPKFEEFFKLFRNLNSDPIISVGSGECGLEIHLEKSNDNNNEKIISFGSGKCELEIHLEKSNDNNNEKIICVDPNPGSFSNDRFFVEKRKPDYPLVQDLVESKPDIVGNCNLMLIWPSPNEIGGSYDIKAVKDLNPKSVLIVFESTGSSGSPSLLNMIEKIDTKDSDNNFVVGESREFSMFGLDLSDTDTKIELETKYVAIRCYRKKTVHPNDVFYHKYLILLREDQFTEEIKPFIENAPTERSEDPSCSIM